MDGTEKTGMDRENPYAATPPLGGHTYVPWVPGTCNATRRQIVWVATSSIDQTGLKQFGGAAAAVAAAIIALILVAEFCKR